MCPNIQSLTSLARASVCVHACMCVFQPAADIFFFLPMKHGGKPCSATDYVLIIQSKIYKILKDIWFSC